MMLAMLTMTLAASAQFEQGVKFGAINVNGFDLSYNGLKDLSVGLQLKGGYFVEDNWQVNGQVGFDHAGKGAKGVFSIGAGGRYYIQDNGIFIGANVKANLSKGYNDVMPGVEIGYAFFLDGKITVEPSIYYDQSLKNHSDYSTVGLRIGVGYYF